MQVGSPKAHCRFRIGPWRLLYDGDYPYRLPPQGLPAVKTQTMFDAHATKGVQ